MRTSTTLLLALGTLLLGLWLVLAESPDTTTADLPPLLRTAPEGVTNIRIVRPDETVVLERDSAPGARWRIVAPRAERADNRRVQALLETLARSRPTRMLPPEMAATAGLEPPRTRLELTSSAGTQSLELGRTAPLGKSVYARTGEQGIVLAPADVGFAADRGFDDLRDRLLFAGLPTPDAIEWQRPGLPDLRLEREDDGWQIREPVHAPADGDRVATVLERLGALRAERFLDDPDDTARTERGLDMPSLTIVIEGTGQPRKLALGGADTEGDTPAGWVRVNEEDRLASVTRESLRAVDISPEELRDRRILRIDPERFVRILLQRKGAEGIELRRSGERWESTPDSLDPASLERFVADLAMLRSEIDGYPAGGAQPTPPAFSIRIEGADGQPLALLDFRESADAVFTVTRDRKAPPQVIGPHAFARLDKRAADLR